MVVALNNGSTAQHRVHSRDRDILRWNTVVRMLLSNTIYTVSSGAVQITLPPRTGVLLVRGSGSQQLDQVPPIAAITLSPALNSNGWTNSLR